MKTWIFIIGLIIMFFGIYPPFQLMAVVIGGVIALIGLIIKSKKKEIK